ncbi:MAG: hypothetical protein U0002_16330 [Thermoanaerobaculia bacterium]
MAAFVKGLVGIGVAVGLIFASSGVVLGATVVSSGLVHIQVDESKPGGMHLNLPIPAALVQATVANLPAMMPERERERIHQKLGPIAPKLKALLAALDDAPDAVLVSVDSTREQVRIEKVGGSLKIHVHSAEEEVNVSIPLSTVDSVLTVLA